MTAKPQLAFIRRYSCLYTRDLHKKAKSWQDGYLVFHHLNAKMVLLSDKFVILDECFYRAPGINVLRDIPKQYQIPSDTSVSFDKHLATSDEAVFEEEKDISELYEKKRKKATDLDDFVDSEDDGRQVAPRKCNKTAASLAALEACDSRPAQPGWLYRTGKPVSSSTAAASSSRVAAPVTSVSAKAMTCAQQATPVRTQATLCQQRHASRVTPKTTTPFKAPSFIAAGPASSPAPSRPVPAGRRTLGSTRPSSLLAERSLQAEWSKYADRLPTCAGKVKGTSNSSLRQGESSTERLERRAAHLEQVKNIPEPEIVSVNQKRRDGEPGDPSSWLFES